MSELKHYGILGMKWGVRRYQPYPPGQGHKGTFKGKYKAKSLKGIAAARANKKVDAGFKKWDEGAKNRENAIAAGKKANLSRRAYEKDRENKDLKVQAKSDSKEYKKALRKNTTHRKGQVRGEVHSDISRKYLSEAKKLEKALSVDPGNRELRKQYNHAITNYNVERVKARRAPEVGAKRSRRIASLKRARTMAVKGAVATVAIAGVTLGANEILKRNGHSGITEDHIRQGVNIGKQILRQAQYIY